MYTNIFLIGFFLQIFPILGLAQLCSNPPDLELISNGDFEKGTEGFSSSYTLNPSLFEEGTYNVGTNANLFHPGFIGVPYNNSQKFLIVNGSASPNKNVWCSTVSNIVPNTTYFFSAYVTTVASSSPAKLQFYVNGKPLGKSFFAPELSGSWQQFFSPWFSENLTNAEICLVNQNIQGGGNDFGLDNISFNASCSSLANSGPKPQLGKDTIVCGGNINLNLNSGIPNKSSLRYTWSTGSTQENITVNAPGEYILCVDSAALGCYKSDTIVVSVLNPLPPKATDVSICMKEKVPPLNIDYNESNTLLWYTDTLQNNPSTKVPFIDSSKAKEYTFFISQVATVKDLKCESKKIPLKVNVHSLPIAQLSSLKLCSGEEKEIAVEKIPNYKYIWKNSDQSIIGNTSTIKINPLNNSSTPKRFSYQVEIVDSTTGCKTLDTATAMVFQKPKLTFTSVSPLCVGQPKVKLTAYPLGGAIKGTFVENNIFNPQEAGDFNLMYHYTDSNSCSDSISQKVIVNEIKNVSAEVGNDTSICEGRQLRLSAVAAKNFIWLPGNETTRDILIKPVKTTTYIVKAIDSSKCLVATDSIKVTVDSPVKEMIVDSEVLYCFDNGLLELKAQNAEKYEWNYQGLEKDIIQVDKEGIYKVTGYNGSCKGVDSITVIDKCETTLFIPDAFSPNGDGLNETFQIFGNHLYNFKIQIFSRWGEEIFYSNSPAKEWDGTYLGSPMPAGVYSFNISYQSKIERQLSTIFKNGTVVLIR